MPEENNIQDAVIVEDAVPAADPAVSSGEEAKEAPSEVNKESEKKTVEKKADETPSTDAKSAPEMPVEAVKPKQVNYLICPHCLKPILEDYIKENVKMGVLGKDETESIQRLGQTVRSPETGDRVFWVNENKRHWVKNPETLKKLGFTLGQEKSMTYTEMNAIEEGDPVDLTVPDAKTGYDEIDKEVEKKEQEATKNEPTKAYKVWS